MQSQYRKLSVASIASLALFASLTSHAQMNSRSGKWTLTGSMSTARSGHAAVRLRDGRVLAAGGMNAGTVLASSEVYDPETGLWSPTGDLGQGRSAATTVLLPNGKVLLAGGCINTCDSPTSSAELYDPNSGAWSATGSMNTPRYSHRATVLKNGRVLVAGGCVAPNCASVTESAEVYNVATGTWAFTGSLHTARAWHAATALADGKVMVTGGLGPNGILSETEIYDPATRTWANAANMQMARAAHAAVLMADGKVMVTGGKGGAFQIALLCSVELFDPSTAKWTYTKNMQKMRENHTTTLLPNGRVLVAGGTTVISIDGHVVYLSEDSAELYDSRAATWKVIAMNGARSGHTATLLKNGEVLAAGGTGSGGEVVSADLYQP